MEINYRRNGKKYGRDRHYHRQFSERFIGEWTGGFKWNTCRDNGWCDDVVVNSLVMYRFAKKWLNKKHRRDGIKYIRTEVEFV